ncbi:MAG: hypothetical protein JSW41_02305, partial [Candidatus Aenigmatarchaeota archaeon]
AREIRKKFRENPDLIFETVISHTTAGELRRDFQGKNPVSHVLDQYIGAGENVPILGISSDKQTIIPDAVWDRLTDLQKAMLDNSKVINEAGQSGQPVLILENPSGSYTKVRLSANTLSDQDMDYLTSVDSEGRNIFSVALERQLSAGTYLPELRDYFQLNSIEIGQDADKVVRFKPAGYNPNMINYNNNSLMVAITMNDGTMEYYGIRHHVDNHKSRGNFSQFADMVNGKDFYVERYRPDGTKILTRNGRDYHKLSGDFAANTRAQVLEQLQGTYRNFSKQALKREGSFTDKITDTPYDSYLDFIIATSPLVTSVNPQNPFMDAGVSLNPVDTEVSATEDTSKNPDVEKQLNEEVEQLDKPKKRDTKPRKQKADKKTGNTAADEKIKKARERAKKKLRRYQPMKGMQVMTDAEWNWLKTTYGANLNVAKGMDRVLADGKDAFGYYHNAMITLAEGAAAGTGYHEAFHLVFDLGLTPKQREDILKQAAKKYGVIRTTAKQANEAAEKAFKQKVSNTVDTQVRRWLKNYGIKLDNAAGYTSESFMNLAGKYAALGTVEGYDKAVAEFVSVLLLENAASPTLNNALRRIPELENIYKRNKGAQQEAKLKVLREIVSNRLEIKRGEARAKGFTEEVIAFLEEILRKIKNAFTNLSAVETLIDKELDKILADPSVRITPKKGFYPMNFQGQVDSLPIAGDVISTMAQDPRVVLTGSLAMSTQGKVYRKEGKPHDLDFRGNMSVAEADELMERLFPGRHLKVFEFKGKGDDPSNPDAMINTWVIGDSPEALTLEVRQAARNSTKNKMALPALPDNVVQVDIFTGRKTANSFEHEFEHNGETRTANLTRYDTPFDANLEMLWDKDLNDYREFKPTRPVKRPDKLVTDDQLEEMLANDLMVFMRQREAGNYPANSVITKFFRMIRDYINKLLGRRLSLDQLFENIASGNVVLNKSARDLATRPRLIFDRESRQSAAIDIGTFKFHEELQSMMSHFRISLAAVVTDPEKVNQALNRVHKTIETQRDELLAELETSDDDAVADKYLLYEDMLDVWQDDVADDLNIRDGLQTMIKKTLSQNGFTVRVKEVVKDERGNEKTVTRTIDPAKLDETNPGDIVEENIDTNITDTAKDDPREDAVNPTKDHTHDKNHHLENPK